MTKVSRYKLTLYIAGPLVSGPVPCAMEVSSGPAPATPPPSAAPPPHGGDKPGQGGLDCPMEDRGVDLSFDLGTQVKREAGDQDPGPALKMEAASPAPAPSPAQSPGGRLKIFKGK